MSVKSLIKSSKSNNTKDLFAKKIKEIESKTQQNDQEKTFVYDQTIQVGDEAKTFYYTYDNQEYYFTAKNAQFKINKNGEIIWYYGQWIDGFFRNGTWICGTWNNGTFCRGNWLDGKWINGKWFKGSINGTQSEQHP